MRRDEHFTHDAMEIYAVAVMQRLAQDRGIALSDDADVKYDAFVRYAGARGLGSEWFESGPYPEFKLAVDTHLPAFIDRLAATLAGVKVDFISVEKEYRNAGLKGDVVIRDRAGKEVSLSLKNYRGDIMRPQFNSQTFRSFLLGFLFEPTVGMYADPTTGKKFRGARVDVRDAALIANGYGDMIAAFHELDRQNETLKAQFIYNDDFAVLTEANEAVLDEWRKRIGHEGADIAVEALGQMPSALVKARIMRMIGLDGSEELLLMDPTRWADTITNRTFRDLRAALLAGTVEIGKRNQGIQVRLANDGVTLLTVDFPFTINANGAWFMERTPPEGFYHSGEKRVLHFRDRRPMKSKQLSTMVLTYIDLSRTGIFD